MKAPGSIVCEARTRSLHPSVRPRPAPIRSRASESRLDELLTQVRGG